MMKNNFLETLKNLLKNKYIYAVGAAGIMSIICAIVILSSGLINVNFDPDDYSPPLAADESNIVFDGVTYAEGLTDDNGDTVSKEDESNQMEEENESLNEDNNDDVVTSEQNKNNDGGGSEILMTVGRLSDNKSDDARVDALIGVGNGTGNTPILKNSSDGIMVTGNANPNGSVIQAPTENNQNEPLETDSNEQSANSTNSQQQLLNNNNQQPSGDTKQQTQNNPTNVQIRENINPTPAPAPAPAPEVTPTKKPSSGNGGSSSKSSAASEPSKSDSSNPSGSDVTAPTDKKPTQPSQPTTSDDGVDNIGGNHGANSGEATEIQVSGDYSNISKGASVQAVFLQNSARTVRLVFENGDSMPLINADYTAAGVTISGFDTSKETSKATAKVTYRYNSKTYTADIPYSVKQWSLTICGFDGGTIASNIYPNSDLSVNLKRYYDAMQKINPQFCGWRADNSGDIITDTYFMSSPTETLYPCTEMKEAPKNDMSDVLIIPNGYTDIDFSSFGICENYESIQIPSTVQNINLSQISENLINVKNIIVDDGNSVYSSVDGVLYKGDTLLYVPPKKESITEFKDGVTNIGSYAFENCEIDIVVLPDTVNEIEGEAFLNALLGELTISSDYYHIGENAFFSDGENPSVQKIISKALYTSEIDDEALNFGANEPIIEIPDSKGDVIYQRYLAEWGTQINSIYGEQNAETILITETDAQDRNILSGNAVYSFFETSDEYTLVCVNEDTTGEFHVDEKTVKIAAGAFEGCNKITAVAIKTNPIILEDGCFNGMDSFTALSLSCEPTEITVNTFSEIDPDEFNIIVLNKYYEQYMEKWGTVLDEQFGREVSIQIFTVAFEGGYIIIDGARYIQKDDALTLMRVPETTTGCFIPAEGTTKIAKDAFYGALQLDSVIIPETVTEIAANAMSNGASIASVFVNSSTKLDLSSFNGAELFVLSEQKELYTDEFADIQACDNLYEADEKNIIYSGDMLVRVPKSYSGELNIRDNTTAIYERAAKDCRDITSVVFNNDVAQIGDEAFYNCTSINNISFGDTPIEKIGARAFYSCVRLKNIEIPCSTEIIGEEAFARCDSLSYIGFGEQPQLKIIENNAFYGCSALQGINANNALQLDTLSEITEIGEDAFANCPLIQNVVLPNNLSVLSDGLFENCVSLDTVTWNGAGQIGKNAFRGSGFKNVDLSLSNVYSIDDGAFADCDNLYTIAFGSALTNISSSFANDGAQIIMYLPNGVPSAGDDISALMANGQLYNVAYTTYENDSAAAVLPNTSPHSGTYIVDNGSLYTNISYKTDRLVKVGINKTEFDMISSQVVEAVDDNAFDGCESLTTVIYNRSTANVPAYAFANNTNLTSFVFRDVQNQNNVPITIGEYAFAGCTSLRNIVLPHNIEDVGEGAFMDCSGLLNVQWYSISDIPNDAFNGCTQMQMFGISTDAISNVKVIGERAFKNCISLSDMGGFNNLHFGVLEEIKDNAFDGCGSIRSFEIPSSVRILGNEVFANCDELESVKISGELDEIGLMIFGYDTGNSYFLVNDAESFREKWGDVLQNDYGEDAPERLIKSVNEFDEAEPTETPIPEETPVPEENDEPEDDEPQPIPYVGGDESDSDEPVSDEYEDESEMSEIEEDEDYITEEVNDSVDEQSSEVTL
jgi:hypothetical protein